MTNLAGETMLMRTVSKFADIAGQPVPKGAKAIVGILTQVTTNMPRVQGCQIMPTRRADIIDATPPVILAQPTNFTVAAGASALFSVNASGAGTLKYQWQFSGVARYRFDPSTWLKGFAVGSAFLWRDEPVIGYKLLPGTALFDITQPYFGAETLNVAASIFMGQTEAPLTIRPFLAKMTQSELMTVMTSGMAHISGGIMAAYIAFGIEARHLLTAVIMTAPGTIMMAKMIQAVSGPKPSPPVRSAMIGLNITTPKKP